MIAAQASELQQRRANTRFFTNTKYTNMKKRSRDMGSSSRSSYEDRGYRGRSENQDRGRYAAGGDFGDDYNDSDYDDNRREMSGWNRNGRFDRGDYREREDMERAQRRCPVGELYS